MLLQISIIISFLFGILFIGAFIFIMINFIRVFRVRRHVFKKYTPEELADLEINKLKAEVEFYKSLANKEK